MWTMGPVGLAFGLSALLGFVEIERPNFRRRWLYDLLGPDGTAAFIAAVGLLFTVAMIVVEFRLRRARRGP